MKLKDDEHKKGFVFSTEKDLDKAIEFFNYAYTKMWNFDIRFEPSKWKGKNRKINVITKGIGNITTR